MRLKIEHIFLIGIFIILLSGISIITNHLGFALKLFSIAFILLVIGTIFYFFDVKK